MLNNEEMLLQILALGLQNAATPLFFYSELKGKECLFILYLFMKPFYSTEGIPVRIKQEK